MNWRNHCFSSCYRDRVRIFIKLILPVILLAILLTAVFLKFSNRIIDTDIWFHLAYGQYIFNNHTLIP